MAVVRAAFHMSLSPRARADFLLLEPATEQRCLEAFATAEGVMLYAGYPNIVSKATWVFRELPALIDEGLPPELVAVQVCRFLDGGYAELEMPETISIDGLIPD